MTAKSVFFRQGWIAGFALAAFLCAAGGAQAQRLTLANTQLLSYGVLQKPTGSATCNMPTPNSCPCTPGYCAPPSTGTPLYVGGTMTDDACYSLKCNNPGCGNSISITAAAATGGCAGLTAINTFTLYYNGSAVSGTTPWTVTSPGNKQTWQFCIEAQISYDSSVVPGGTCSPTLTVTADTETDTSSIALGFDSALTLTKISDIDFGTVQKGACTYRISTAGAVSVVSGTGCGALSGTPVAGNINVKGSSTQSITLSASGFTSDRGVSILHNANSPKGGYNGASALVFPITGTPPSATGKTLLLGADVQASGAQTDGTTYSPSFTVNADYQ